MRRIEARRRATAAPDATGSRLGVGLARLAFWLVRIATAVVLALPLLLLALWLAG